MIENNFQLSIIHFQLIYVSVFSGKFFYVRK